MCVCIALLYLYFNKRFPAHSLDVTKVWHAYIRTRMHTYIHNTHLHTYIYGSTYAISDYLLMNQMLEKKGIHMCVHTSIQAYICTYIHTHTHTHTHTYIHTWQPVCNQRLSAYESDVRKERNFPYKGRKTGMHACMHVWVHMCVCMRVCISACMCMHACMHVWVHVYVCFSANMNHEI